MDTVKKTMVARGFLGVGGLMNRRTQRIFRAMKIL